MALAERYAPVVRLVDQPTECGPGEPYLPIDVDLLFDEPTVALRGPWGGGDLVKVAPRARDLSPGLYEYHLDFPGNALDPGCGYERWARRLETGTEPAVYAHVATDPDFPGQLALQYWFFYVFNDWNNLHEGDWETIQLLFDASNASEALARSPTRVGYSQHEGAEGANWGDDKLELIDGTHPVVYPAAGSHANFYEEALYLGASGSQGVGCDDTRGPRPDLRPVVRTIPSSEAEARTAFPWIAFEGRWGELQPAFFNGPTGPNLKGSWTHPIASSQGWRERAYAVPAGGLFGTAATDFFCSAIASGSVALQRVLDHPAPALLAAGALALLVLYGLSRATWHPATPLRLARRRAWGQILAAAARMYLRRLPLFIGIGLVLLPISLLVTSLQALLLGGASAIGIEAEGESGGFFVVLAVWIGTALTVFGLGFVQATTARALVEIDEGRTVSPLRAYRIAAARVLPLLGAVALAVAVGSLLLLSIFLVPIAIWLAVRWALIALAVELEGAGATDALRRSSRLVGQCWLKVASLTVVGAALALAAGPLLGALLIVLTTAPLGTLNLVASVVYAVAMPFVAITTTYVYFDVRVRDELERPNEEDILPAEIAHA